MLEYDRIGISEEIVTSKTSPSKECDICHYCYFKDTDFKYEPYLCNVCHGLIKKAINFNDDAYVSIKENDYRIHFWYMSKDDAINVMKNVNLNEKVDHYIFFSLYIKMSETTYYQRNRETMLKRAKDCCQNKKKVLRERAKNKYRELSEEDKNIKREYGKNRYHNMSEKEKQKLKEYQKKLS